MAERNDATDRGGDLSWGRHYDRATVERFLTEAAEKRAELEADLAQALGRVERARAALEQREAARSAELAAMVAEAHRQLVAIEADHEAAVEAARAAAQEEVERIRAQVSAAPTSSDGRQPS